MKKYWITCWMLAVLFSTACLYADDKKAEKNATAEEVTEEEEAPKTAKETDRSKWTEDRYETEIAIAYEHAQEVFKEYQEILVDYKTTSKPAKKQYKKVKRALTEYYELLDELQDKLKARRDKMLDDGMLKSSPKVKAVADRIKNIDKLKGKYTASSLPTKESEIENTLSKKLDFAGEAKTGRKSKEETPKVSSRDSKRKAGDRMVKKLRGVEFAFRWCPPGKFTMGGPRGEWDGSKWVDKNDQHEVILTQGFWMLETEVTQAMWSLVMGNNPSEFQGANRPVERVSWDECQEFCRRLSGALKMNISLPTDAQWEYACRAGTTTKYYWGDDEGQLWKYGNYCEQSNTNNFGWQDKNHNDGHDKTAPVRSYKPNAWGLYDMAGNVREWCQDWYGDYPSGAVTDPTGPKGGSYRVSRGGSWISYAQDCRSADRYRFSASDRINDLGFRVVGSSK